MARQNNRYTVYDMLDAKGHFDTNPANPGARNDAGDAIYAGPVEFPKMFYHPQGETRVTAPGEIIVTPLGPKQVGQQFEIHWPSVWRRCF